MFLSNDFGRSIHFTGNFWSDASPLWRYLLIPQCWSVGVELTFYVFAPYLNTLRSRWLLCLAFIALTLRLLAYWRLNLAHDPWNYRFFPFEICLFLFGMLGYRLYLKTIPHHPSQRFHCVTGFSYLISIVVLLFLLYIQARGVTYLSRIAGSELAELITYPFWALAIPVLFSFFRNQKIDRVIGEMSYPIYLVHYIVISVITVLLAHVGIKRGIGLNSAIVSVILATVLYRTFIIPLNRKRYFFTHIQANHLNQTF